MIFDKRENRYHLVKGGESYFIKAHKGKDKVSCATINPTKRLIISILRPIDLQKICGRGPGEKRGHHVLSNPSLIRFWGPKYSQLQICDSKKIINKTSLEKLEFGYVQQRFQNMAKG